MPTRAKQSHNRFFFTILFFYELTKSCQPMDEVCPRLPSRAFTPLKPLGRSINPVKTLTFFYRNRRTIGQHLGDPAHYFVGVVTHIDDRIRPKLLRMFHH